MRVNTVWVGRSLLSTVMVASSAFAANSDIRIEKPEAVNGQVSVSRDCKDSNGNAIPRCTAFNSFAGVVVTATNNTTNTVNKVVFDALVTVIGGGRAQLAYAIPDVCTASDGENLNEKKVRCNVGQLKGSTDVVLIFQVPTTGSQLDFEIVSGTFSSGASPDSTPASLEVDPIPAMIELVTISTSEKQTNFKTVVPPVGGTFFTGFGVPSDIDTFVTRLNVPSQGTASYSIASADEKTPAQEACPTSAPCGGSVDISLKKKDQTKATFYPSNPVDVLKEFLVIELWRSDFKGNIKNANVYYKDPDETNPTYVQIFECAPYPLAGSVARCIFDRKVFTNKDEEVKTGQVPAGSARIRILAGENGFYAW